MVVVEVVVEEEEEEEGLFYHDTMVSELLTIGRFWIQRVSLERMYLERICPSWI